MTSLIVCVNGDLGSGKSLVSRNLAEKLDAEYISTGLLQRLIAQARGLTTLELNQEAAFDSSIDAQLDEAFVGLEKKYERLIVDSRMAWHRLPASVKVRLVCDSRTAANRVMEDKSRTAEQYENIEIAAEKIMRRQSLEQERYRQRYGVDMHDYRNYDLLLRTDNLLVSEVADQIIANLSYSATKPLIIGHSSDFFPTCFPPPVCSSGRQTTGAIKIALVRWEFFVLEGHEQLLDALKAHDRVLYGQPVSVASQAVEDALPSPDLLKAWEAATDVRYPRMPQFLRPL